MAPTLRNRLINSMRLWVGGQCVVQCVCLFAYVYVCICVYVCTFVYECVRSSTHTHTHTHIYIYIHILPGRGGFALRGEQNGQIWNFHVWGESFFRRPGYAPNWQVLDGTYMSKCVYVCQCVCVCVCKSSPTETKQSIIYTHTQHTHIPAGPSDITGDVKSMAYGKNYDVTFTSKCVCINIYVCMCVFLCHSQI
jgi:hypothetical protein